MNDHDVVDRLHQAVDATPVPERTIATMAAAVRRRRAVRRSVAAVGVTAAVLGAAMGVVQIAPTDRIDLAGKPTAPDELLELRELPTSPLDPRSGAFSMVSNDGLFVWGGYATGGNVEGLSDDGAGYWNGRWAAMADGPLTPRMRMNSAAGWIHDEYWIVGGTGGADGRTPLRDAAAFRPTGPREGEWYELPAVPEPIVSGATVVDETMVVIAQSSGGNRAVYQLAPGDRQWDKLEQSLPPADPSAADNSDLHLVDASGYLVVVGQGQMFMIINGLNQGVGLEWQRVPPPEGARTFGNVRGAMADFSRDTDGVVVLMPDGTYRYDLSTGAWSRIADGLQPDPPQPIPLMRTTDDALIAVDLVGGHVHALSDDEWTTLAALDSPRIEASVELLNGLVPGFGDLAGNDPEHETDESEVFDFVVVWGGIGSESPGTAQSLVLPLPQDVDP